MKSAFMEWFVLQHGPRETCHTDRTDTQLEQAIAQGESSAKELGRRKTWDTYKTSALWAWQAKSPDQGGGKP